MFAKEIYIARRKALLEKMAQTAPQGKRGIALFVGNVEAAAQYKDNAYKFRQDSSWLYFFGLDEPRYAAILDLDSGEETVFADDVEIGDIIWMGPQPSVASKAAEVGVKNSASYGSLNIAVTKALAIGRNIHFLPPSRYYNTMKLAALVGISNEDVARVAPIDEDGGKHASKELVQAVISMRLVKEQCEIEQIDDAGALGQRMHTVARNSVKVGIIEQEIVGKMEGVTLSEGWGVSFPTILTQPHGLGHNMGLDVHDMEDLGEDLVGYDPDQKRSTQLGLGSLRMARRLVPGNVITDEPGIYFIPALIEKWKSEKRDKGFVNYYKLEHDYLDFGGIRLEDDVLVTEDGARRTGPNRLPIQPDDVEAAMA